MVVTASDAHRHPIGGSALGVLQLRAKDAMLLDPTLTRQVELCHSLSQCTCFSGCLPVRPASGQAEK